jgi:hypothetical protein
MADVSVYRFVVIPFARGTVVYAQNTVWPVSDAGIAHNPQNVAAVTDTMVSNGSMLLHPK